MGAETGSRYFRLASDCLLVNGTDDEASAAVYDLHGPRVLILGERQAQLLRGCEANEPLADPLPDEDVHLLDVLVGQGLGCYEDAPVYVDRFLPHAPARWKEFLQEAPSFSRLDWSITDECVLDCEDCARPDEVVGWQACLTCLRRTKSSATPPSLEAVIGTVSAAAALGFQLIHLRGGDPLRAWEALQQVAATVADHPPLGLMVSTPGLGRATQEYVGLASKLSIRTNAVLVAPPDGSLGESASTFERQAAFVDALLSVGLPTTVTMLLSEQAASRRDELTVLALKRWGGIPSFAETRSRVASDTRRPLARVADGNKPLTPWPSVEGFFARFTTSSCLAGNVELGTDGHLRPCAGLDADCGDASDGLTRALADPAPYRAWGLTKDAVTPCAGCVLRYACVDCTAVELAGQADPGLQSAYCPAGPSAAAYRATTWSPSGFAQLAGVAPAELVHTTVGGQSRAVGSGAQGSDDIVPSVV